MYYVLWFVIYGSFYSRINAFFMWHSICSQFFGAHFIICPIRVYEIFQCIGEGGRQKMLAYNIKDFNVNKKFIHYRKCETKMCIIIFPLPSFPMCYGSIFKSVCFAAKFISFSFCNYNISITEFLNLWDD